MKFLESWTKQTTTETTPNGWAQTEDEAWIQADELLYPDSKKQTTTKIPQEIMTTTSQTSGTWLTDKICESLVEGAKICTKGIKSYLGK